MREIGIYKQIPMITLNSGCKLCGSALSIKKPTEIIVYNGKDKKMKTVVDLLFCSKCRIGYATSDIFTCIREKNKGFSAYGFTVSSKSSAERVALTISSDLPQYKHRKKALRINKSNPYLTEHPHSGFQTFPLSSSMVHKIIYITNIKLDNSCPCCSSALKKDSISIPVNKTSEVSFKGYSCGGHFFSFPSKNIKNLLKNNPYAEHINADFSYFFPALKNAKDIFESNNCHEIMLLLKSSNYRGNLILIISNSKTTSNDGINIINYREVIARKILTKIFKYEETQIYFDGTKYKLCSVIYKKHNDDLSPTNRIIGKIMGDTLVA